MLENILALIIDAGFVYIGFKLSPKMDKRQQYLVLGLCFAILAIDLILHLLYAFGVLQ